MAKCPNSDNTLSGPTLLDRARNSMPVYYTPAISVERQAAVIGIHLQAFLQAGPAERSTIYMVYLWAMRVGEYLNVTTRDLRGNDMVFVRGEKGSASYIIQAPGIDVQFERASPFCPGRLVSGTTYQRVYRACLRLGLGILLPGHVNLARTHAARYHLAADLVPRGTQAASDCLRHRSGRSLSHYTGA